MQVQDRLDLCPVDLGDLEVHTVKDPQEVLMDMDPQEVLMDTDPQEDLDLWEDPRMVPHPMVIPKEVHLQEVFQHKDLEVLCLMEVHRICKIYKG